MNAAPVDHKPGHRLQALDALRGVAALAVVGYHYTTRYLELYGTGAEPSVTVPWGHYGVNLFFIISGFVIFMTLARTRRPMDFVVSRFSRLFPAYWVAIAITFAVTSAFVLPGKTVTVWQALANGLMLHGFARVPHVDGVYWTLEVELLFYAAMLALYASGRLHATHLWLWALLAMRLAYHVAAVGFGYDASWTLSRILILKYIPWFALGIVIYWQTTDATANRMRSGSTVVLAIGCLAIVDGWGLAMLAAALGLLVWAAATGRLPWLGHRALVFFGAISYTLYLLHENIGWVVMREAQARGVSFNGSIVLALGVTVCLASAVTTWVERPAMRVIRDLWRRRPLPAAA
jgi:peptidoglycan/LPS O-acetylase OafA/YrhL